jgi:hypothetical protein
VSESKPIAYLVVQQIPARPAASEEPGAPTVTMLRPIATLEARTQDDAITKALDQLGREGNARKGVYAAIPASSVQMKDNDPEVVVEDKLAPVAIPTPEALPTAPTPNPAPKETP